MTTHVITEFPLEAGSRPHGVILAPDGNFLYTEEGADRISEFNITTDQPSVVATLPAGSGPHEILKGPDGNFYITEFIGNRIDRLNYTTRQVTQFPTSIPAGADASVLAEAIGPDNNSIWFTEFTSDRLGKLDLTTGKITEYRCGITLYARPLVIAVGPDGNIWFGEPFRRERGVQKAAIARLIPSVAGQFVNDPNRCYVDTLYQQLLGRDSDPAGVNTFTNQLNNGVTRQQIVLEIEASPEYQNVLIGIAYGTYLHRNSDPKGQSDAFQSLQKGGNFSDIENAILSSNEYFRDAGRTNDGFINRLYADLLNRAADPAGLASFRQMLASGASRSAIVRIFQNSAERGETIVKTEYGRFLSRDTDPGGLDFFSKMLSTSHAVPLVDSTLIASAEYFLLHITGPTPFNPVLPPGEAIDG
jgi:hypothetical protein